MRKALCFLLACSLMSGCTTWKAVGFNQAAIDEANLKGRKIIVQRPRHKSEIFIFDHADYPMVYAYKLWPRDLLVTIDLSKSNRFDAKQPSTKGTTLLVSGLVGSIAIIFLLINGIELFPDDFSI